MRPVSATRWLILAAVVLCIALLLVGFAVVSWFTGGVQVVVTNKTGAEVKNLEVEFTGGVVTIPTLKPGTAYQATVQPTGESHLELRFTDASGKEHSQTIGVYLEEHYRGRILIDLGPDGKVVYQDQSRLPY